jgi:hypothetical protein
MSSAPPRSAALDLAVGVVGIWLATGFLWDSWAHLHVPVESFFTPYHGIFYSAMLAGTLLLGGVALRNRARGYRGWNVLPSAYHLPLLGIPIFFLGGVGDLIWHSIFGIEERVAAVTSPTHLIIGIGVLTVTGAPIRSALQARGELRSLLDYLPMVLALATWIEFVHLGTSYAFDPAAARIYAPPNGFLYSPDYFTNLSLLLFRSGAVVAIIILRSLILMAFVIWMVTRFRLAPGALTVFFLLGNCIIAAALTNDTPMLLTYVLASLAGGIVADVLVSRGPPSLLYGRRLYVFSFVVPFVFYATYYAVTLATGGTWVEPPIIGGSLVWAGVSGLGLSLLAPVAPQN